MYEVYDFMKKFAFILSIFITANLFASPKKYSTSNEEKLKELREAFEYLFSTRNVNETDRNTIAERNKIDNFLVQEYQGSNRGMVIDIYYEYYVKIDEITSDECGDSIKKGYIGEIRRIQKLLVKTLRE